MLTLTIAAFGAELRRPASCIDVPIRHSPTKLRPLQTDTNECSEVNEYCDSNAHGHLEKVCASLPHCASSHMTASANASGYFASPLDLCAASLKQPLRSLPATPIVASDAPVRKAANDVALKRKGRAAVVQGDYAAKRCVVEGCKFMHRRRRDLFEHLEEQHRGDYPLYRCTLGDAGDLTEWIQQLEDDTFAKFVLISDEESVQGLRLVQYACACSGLYPEPNATGSLSDAANGNCECNLENAAPKKRRVNCIAHIIVDMPAVTATSDGTRNAGLVNVVYQPEHTGHTPMPDAIQHLPMYVTTRTDICRLLSMSVPVPDIVKWIRTHDDSYRAQLVNRQDVVNVKKSKFYEKYRSSAGVTDDVAAPEPMPKTPRPSPYSRPPML
eukprot:Opistho-2@46093